MSEEKANKMTKALYFLNIFASIMLFLFILTSSILLVTRAKFLYPIFSKDLKNENNLTKEVIKQNYSDLIDYNMDKNIKNLDFQGLKMSQSGRIHFEEVKEIFGKVKSLAIFSSIGLFVSAIFLVKKKSYKFVRLGGRLSLVLPSILIFAIAIDFDSAFVFFHKIFFNNDYWIFNSETDPIINYLPESFFMWMAVSILFVYINFVLIIRAIYGKLNEKPR